MFIFFIHTHKLYEFMTVINEQFHALWTLNTNIGTCIQQIYAYFHLHTMTTTRRSINQIHKIASQTKHETHVIDILLGFNLILGVAHRKQQQYAAVCTKDTHYGFYF